MIVSEQLNYTKTRWFHAIFMPVIIEFSRCIGIYSSAKFELIIKMTEKSSGLFSKISRTKLWKLLIENSFGIYLFHQQIIYLTIILLNGRVIPIVQVFLSFSIAIVVTSFMVIILRKFKITRLLFSL